MPPTRRRPTPSGQQPPVRRPRVAGLRNRQSTAPRQEAETPRKDVEEPAPAVEEAATEAPHIDDDGVVTGVLGESAPAEDTDEAVEAEEPVEDTAEAEDEPAAERPKPVPARPRREPRTPGTSRPTGKRRSAGVVRPSTREDEKPRAKAEPAAPSRPSPLANRLNVAILLAVIAAVLAGLAFWFRTEADSLGTGEGNAALTDTGATTAAIGQLTSIVEDTFSYNYTDLASTEKAVEAGITGKASCEYEKLFKVVLENAPSQQLILTTEVRKVSLERLEGDRATALAFIDQTTMKAGAQNAVAGGGGMLGITAQRIDGKWKIVEFDTFNKTLPNGQEAPSC